ncbi:hypothetical protein ACC684_38480, partial [Rhizobium ruizarguesonis]
ALTVKDVITGYGSYPMPIGPKGLAMIDVRDIAEIAAHELLEVLLEALGIVAAVVDRAGEHI